MKRLMFLPLSWVSFDVHCPVELEPVPIQTFKRLRVLGLLLITKTWRHDICSVTWLPGTRLRRAWMWWCRRRVAHDRVPYQLRESFQESLFAGMRVPIKSSSFTFDRTRLTRYKQRCSHSLLVPQPNPCTVRRRRITSITPSHHCNQRRIVRTEPSRPYQSESDACLLQPRIPHLGQT
jgi:hypothetical protein